GALQDDKTGGMRIEPPGNAYSDLTDMLSTAQAGIAALAGGRMELADAVRRWLVRCLAEQPSLPHILHTIRSAGGLVTEPPRPLLWSGSVHFDQPRQAYFFPGIAAAFLALYAMRTGDKLALKAGHEYLALNRMGTSEQFDDLA